MRKTILHIVLLSLIGLYSCKSTKSDFGTEVSNTEIYDFMKFVISDLNISDSINIQIKPTLLFYKESGKNGFNISEFTDSNSNNNKGILKPSDTIFVLNQNNRIFNGFNWDLAKLGYKRNDNPMTFEFSLPYFTKNRDLVIIWVSRNNTSAFMAGSSELLYYEKINNSWRKQTLKSILN